MNERIGLEVEATVRDKDMPADQRESIVDMLGAAGHAANGAPDKTQAIAEAVQSMAIFLSRQARHETARTRDAIAFHASMCPMAGAGRVALTMWQYRRHVTAVAAVFLGSLGLSRAPWMGKLMDALAAAAGVGP